MKIFIRTLIVLIVAGMGGYVYYQYTMLKDRDAQISQLNEAKAVTENEKTQLTASLNDVTATVNEVAAKLQDVRKLHVVITDLVSRAGDAELSQKDRLIDDISAIEKQLDRDKRDIGDLTLKIQQSGVRIKSLETMVTGLKKELDANIQMVGNLRSIIEHKNAVIETTENSLRETESTLATVRNELHVTNTELEETKSVLEDTRNTANTAYVAFGTKKELVEKNVLDEQGRLFKNVMLAKDFDESTFSKIDITSQNEFTVASNIKDVKVYPQRSDECFRLEPAGENQSVLKVTDPEKFWKIRYMAVVVKG